MRIYNIYIYVCVCWYLLSILHCWWFDVLLKFDWWLNMMKYQNLFADLVGWAFFSIKGFDQCLLVSQLLPINITPCFSLNKAHTLAEMKPLDLCWSISISIIKGVIGSPWRPQQIGMAAWLPTTTYVWIGEWTWTTVNPCCENQAFGENLQMAL